MSLLNTIIPSLARTSPATPESRSSDLTHAVKPFYDITENNDAFGVTVQLPGVAKGDLEITVEESQVSIVGRRSWKQPESWTALHRETVDAPFELILAHENTIDADKVVAELHDGLLRVSLPKHEAIKPRKITVG